MPQCSYESIEEYCKGETTPELLYLFDPQDQLTISQIIEKARTHFGKDVDLDQIIVSPSYDQFRCYGYDLFDFTDYGNVLIISLKNQ